MVRKIISFIAIMTMPAVAHAASVTATASIDLIAPLEIISVSDMSFGTFAPPLSGYGSITVGGTSGHLEYDNVVHMGGHSTATVLVSGTPGAYVALEGQPDDTTLSDGNGNTMLMNCANSFLETLDLSGTATFYPMCGLEVLPGQPSGTYSGTYTLTVLYP